MIGEIVIHVVLFLVMLFLYVEAFNFPVLNIGGSLGAKWWPQLLLLLGMILLVLSLFVSVRKIKKEQGKVQKSKISKKEIIALGISFVIISVGLFVTQPLGFLVASFVMACGFMLLLGQKKAWVILLASFIMAVVFTFVFGKLMQVSLPRGTGVLRTISYWIY